MLKKLLLYLIAIIIFFSFASSAISEPEDENYNSTINKKYLFYMHGRWIEMHGRNKTHPKHGYYEYDKIVQYFSQEGFTVISEARSENVDFGEYAKKVMYQVYDLLNQGVKPKDITIIGHSKGGLITLITASMLGEPEMNFVIMAGCGKMGTKFRRAYDKFLSRYASELSGQILSIYDADDQSAGSCQEACDMASNGKSKEIILHTGKGHGIFYYPVSIWTKEIINWAKQK